eukprot:38457-Chlamydomonas_euryale.AAC.7
MNSVFRTRAVSPAACRIAACASVGRTCETFLGRGACGGRINRGSRPTRRWFPASFVRGFDRHFHSFPHDKRIDCGTKVAPHVSHQSIGGMLEDSLLNSGTLCSKRSARDVHVAV